MIAATKKHVIAVKNLVFIANIFTIIVCLHVLLFAQPNRLSASILLRLISFSFNSCFFMIY